MDLRRAGNRERINQREGFFKVTNFSEVNDEWKNIGGKVDDYDNIVQKRQNWYMELHAEKKYIWQQFILVPYTNHTI